MASKKSPNPIDKHVGARVRVRRMMKEMSQTALGDALGITFQQVQKYEKGVNRIGSSRLHKVAQVLDVPVGYFFQGAPGEAPGSEGERETTKMTAFLATPRGLRLTTAFSKIKSNALQETLVDLIEHVAER